MEDSSMHNAGEFIVSLLQKSFIALSGSNIVVGALAFFDFIPAVSSFISMVFLVWVGVLTVRERKKSIRIKELIIEEKEQQRMVSEARG